MYKAVVILLVATLTACSSEKPETLSHIDRLEIPVVPQNQASGQPAELTPLYQQNERIIDNVTAELKTNYLQNVKAREIFDVHSEAHQVYNALSKLDQMRLINGYYLKERNIDGLRRVNGSLQTLAQG